MSSPHATGIAALLDTKLGHILSAGVLQHPQEAEHILAEAIVAAKASDVKTEPPDLYTTPASGAVHHPSKPKPHPRPKAPAVVLGRPPRPGITRSALPRRPKDDHEDQYR